MVSNYSYPSELVVSKGAWDYAMQNRPVHNNIWYNGVRTFPFPWEKNSATYPENKLWNRIIRAYYRKIRTNPEIPHDALFCEYPVTCGEVAIHSIRRKHMVRQRSALRKKRNLQCSM